MVSREHEFTGIGVTEDGGTDIDGLSEYYVHPPYKEFDSLAALVHPAAGEATGAIRAESRQCAAYQGGTNFDMAKDELYERAKPETEEEDLVMDSKDDDIYHTSGEYQLRQWKAEDNTGDPIYEYGLPGLTRTR